MKPHPSIQADIPRCAFGRRAFTLIELITVVAILAILLSILFPALKGAIGKAQEAKCMNNVRNILVARHLYTSEHNGNMIPNRVPYPEQNPTGTCSWRWYLKEWYGVAEDVFRCPAAPNCYSELQQSHSFAAKKDVSSNYAQVGEVFGNDTRSRRWTVIPTLVGQVELVEIRDYWADMNMGSWGWVWADGFGVYGFWHSGMRTTVGYADGHVEVKKLGQTVTPLCQWDTPAGPHDGAKHSEYGAMLDIYK